MRRSNLLLFLIVGDNMRIETIDKYTTAVTIPDTITDYINGCNEFGMSTEQIIKYMNTPGRFVSKDSDRVMTPLWIGRYMVAHFKPTGSCLEPCRGTGNIYKFLPPGSEWCEITEGKDFFDYDKHASWILTNPPYSIIDPFVLHCFKVADNVVLFIPLNKLYKSMSYINMVEEYGGIAEVVVIGPGNSIGFDMGFIVGIVHYKRGYHGPPKSSIMPEHYKNCNEGENR
jgi:hypothetical protein